MNTMRSIAMNEQLLSRSSFIFVENEDRLSGYEVSIQNEMGGIEKNCKRVPLYLNDLNSKLSSFPFNLATFHLSLDNLLYCNSKL